MMGDPSDDADDDTTDDSLPAYTHSPHPVSPREFVFEPTVMVGPPPPEAGDEAEPPPASGPDEPIGP
jgi:hypothetical protein